ncbi:MAG TPA: hypothetical protein VHW23_47985 [Kofleriaceae bacterium]|nr:hypothetical protein [Kofleriaceae bacterium]
MTDHGAVAARTPVAASTAVAASTPTPKDDPSQICPDICGDGTLCVLPSGSCGEVCNACYCTRDGGTVVDACPKAGAAPGALQSLAQAVAKPDGTRSQ